MPSCSHSSNLSGNLNVNSITQSGARLLMTLNLTGFTGDGLIQGNTGGTVDTDGITAGHAIRYDVVSGSPSENKYVPSVGDDSVNSEVVGVIESIDTVSSVVTVVLSGQINYPTGRLLNATGVDPVEGVAGASGGNDIYFLSGTTAGVLQNLAPAEPGKIAKPVLQTAPDGDWTHQVVNYIGYQIGGNLVGEETTAEPTGTVASTLLFGTSTLDGLIGEGWVDSRDKNWFPITTDDLNYNSDSAFLYTKSHTIFGDHAGVRYRLVIPTLESTTLTGVKATQKNSLGVVESSWTINQSEVGGILWVESAGVAIDITKTIDIQNKSYTITEAKKTAFMTPQIKRQREINNKFKTFNGNSLSITQVDIYKCPADNMEFAVSVVPNLTLDKLTVKDGINVENSLYTVTDVAQTLQEMSVTLSALNLKINNEASAFTSRIVSK